VVDARAQQLLREGIALARSPEGREQGRRCFQEAVALDGRFEAAWLWLAGLAEAPEEALQHLEQVLTLNPTNEKARVAARAARLQAGINAARVRDKPRARALLRQASADNHDDEMAWLWLSTVAESTTEGVACLEHVLRLNPANERARASLERHRAQVLSTLPPFSDPTTDEDQPREHGSESAEWTCPYCQSPGEPQPKRCTKCAALLVLTRVADFETHEPAEQGPLLAYIVEIEATSYQEDFGACYELGVAYLNLRRFDAAQDVLKLAQQLQPDHTEVRMAVEELTRQSEERSRDLVGGARRKVLVVDDCPTIRKLVTLTLEARGYQVRAAGDGYEAVDMLRDHGVPDLVLLDIDMPGMDGYQLCKLLRQNPDTTRLPILMLSGKDGFFGKVRSQMAGFTECLFKPFESQELVRIVDSYCPQSAAIASPV
jgi:CheY-like chemotaxis protein